MIVSLIETLGPWSWWIAGVILLGLEIVLPGSIVMWFGIAAIVVGAVSLLVDWPWQAQWIVFGILSVISLIIGRRYFVHSKVETEDEHLNERAARLIGRKLVLSDAIEQNDGRVRIADTLWRVTGPDLPAGAAVKVVGVEGSVLVVVAAEQAA